MLGFVTNHQISKNLNRFANFLLASVSVECRRKMSSLYDWGECLSVFNPLSWKDTETSHFNSFSSGCVYPTDSASSWVESIRSGEAFLFYFFMDEFRNF